MRWVKTCRDQDKALKMNLTTDDDKTRGLVLSGGGAKSIFQAQIIERLTDAGYEFDIISGVSAGSLNAAIVSQQKGNIVDLWSRVDKKDLFTGGISFWRLLKIALGWSDSIYDNSGMESFLEKHYDPSKTKIPFIVGSVNLHTAEYNEFLISPGDKATSWREREIYKAIVASTSIPLVFSPVKDLGTTDGHYFSDGGLRNIAPLKSLIKHDVDEIVVITCSPRHLGTTTRKLNGPFEIAERSFDILLNEIIREDIDSAIKVNRILKEHDGKNGDKEVTVDDKTYRHIDISLIEPRFGLGGLLDFSEDIQKERVEEANNVCDRILKD